MVEYWVKFIDKEGDYVEIYLFCKDKWFFSSWFMDLLINLSHISYILLLAH